MSIKITNFQKKCGGFRKLKMVLEELRFNGLNGHSKILIMPSREEITFPLVRVGSLTLLDISRTKNKHLGENEKSFHRREIELHSIPLNAAYFARSEEHEGLYLGVQYYRAATSEDTLDQRVPVGPPQILILPQLKTSRYDVNHLLDECMKNNGASTYEQNQDIFGKRVVVQYYRMRPA